MPFQMNTTVCLADEGYSHIDSDSCFYQLGPDGSITSTTYPAGGFLTSPGCHSKVPYTENKPCTARFESTIASCCSGGGCSSMNQQVNEALVDAFTP